jgi:phosphate transport system substrate-binding protein
MAIERARKALTFLLVLAACLVGGCRRAERHSLTLAGSTSVQPLAEKWVEAYRARHPGSSISVQGGGSTAGVRAALSGAAQVGLSSRALTRDEQVRLRPITVARDGIALIVHPSNPIRSLSLSELRGLYAGTLVRWPHGRSDLPVTVITREEGSGTRAAFEHLVMAGQPIVARALVSDSTGAVNQMVGSDPAAIGYVSIGLVEPGLRTLQLDGVEPTEANIDSGRYPLVRPFLFVVVGDPEPRARAFIDWVIGPEGAALTRREGMLPPLAEDPRANL